MRSLRTVGLVDARGDSCLAGWLRNVYPLYLHDLSEFAPGEYELTADGRWEPDHLPYWLEKPFCHALVVLEDARPVGFAFVGESPFPFMSPGVRFRLAEFFVLRARRRSGLASGAARAVFERFRGPFELGVLPRNAPALAFWRGMLPAVSQARVREEPDSEVVRFTFDTADVLSSRALRISQAESPAEIAAVRDLLREYQALLGVDLCFQGFESEVRGLPGGYAPPDGRLLLATADGEPVGCVALRAAGPPRCEMKRLFVRPAARGLGAGRALVALVLAEARAIGYTEVVLDTLPSMVEAQRLYEELGFRDILPYRPNPVPGARFLAKTLAGS
jgi:putative acetyltransferase